MKIYSFIICTFLLISLGVFSQDTPKEYKLQKSIPVAGNGTWDNLTFDNYTQRIFIAHENCVQVIDLKTGKQIGIIKPIPGAHDIALAHDLGKGFITAGNIDSVIVFNLNTYKITSKIHTGKGPKAILYDRFSERVFAFNEAGHSVTVIKADSEFVVKTVGLHGSPSAAVTDYSGNIYVTVENLGMVANLDATTLAFKGMFPLGPDKQPSALAFDKGNNNLLIGCSGSNELIVFNVTSTEVVATVPIGMHCEGVSFMPAQGDVLTSNGEGSITVIHQKAAFNFEKIQTLITKRGARTITCDYAKQTFYLPTANFDDTKKEYSKNSFQLLVISR